PVTVVILCRTDEPALGRTLGEMWASWESGPAAMHALELLVCLNGDPARARALDDLRAFAEARATAVGVVDLDVSAADEPPTSDQAVVVRALCTRRTGKAMAWNVGRTRARGSTTLFMDADVSIAPESIGALIGTLAAHPQAVLATGRTGCAARPTWFEAV